MNIIAFDTASDVFAAGLSINNTITKQKYYIVMDAGQKHSELIMDAADTLLKIAGIAKSELQAAACMEGPGSFTGLRIGFAAVKGLSFALGIPFIPVPTLDCMAHSFSFWPGIVLPIMDAKKNAFFTALYRQGKRFSAYLDIEIDDLIKIITKTCSKTPSLLITGPAADLVCKRLSDAFPDTVSNFSSKMGYAAELLNLADKKSILSINQEQFAMGPEYIRKSDVEHGK